MATPNKPFKIICNESIFYFDQEELVAADLVQKSSEEFNCIVGNRSVNAVLVDADMANKKFNVIVDGENYSIQIRDELDQMLEIMGFGLAINKQLTNIKAPMPGLVLEIAVTEGQQVNQGDKIIILEAMKMENSIVIPANATIKKVLVKQGQAVDKGQVLVELDKPV